ncbi:Hsp20/alpha crystallin family protein [Rhizobium daejeonense]|nr:Hsp20/alpha crystallin family protein [Rhizobium daejeonense]
MAVNAPRRPGWKPALCHEINGDRTMAYRSWLPSLWGEKESVESSFGDLRKRIDSLFDDFDRGFPALAGSFAVRSNVSETDKEICITAELPGVEQKDIDVSISGNRIFIKGEKMSEKDEKKEDKGREFHRIERSSGSFQRAMTLPFEIDAGSVKADFKNGVLTVTIPKPAEAVKETRKIEVK